VYSAPPAAPAYVAATADMSHGTMPNGALPNGGAHTAPNGTSGTNGTNGINGPIAEKANWITLLETEAAQMLSSGRPEVMDALGRQFESALIKTALKHTHGRKNDAAVRLGIGRNTITRKIHELGIDGAKDD
jgi:two-component system nitrogen regulation response regulator GlnG